MNNVKQKKLEVKYWGVNFWSQLTFTDTKGNYFVSENHIDWNKTNDSEKRKIVNNLMYCGKDPDDDPRGYLENAEISLVDSF